MEQAAKDIYNEFKDQLRQMNIEYRKKWIRWFVYRFK